MMLIFLHLIIANINLCAGKMKYFTSLQGSNWRGVGGLNPPVIQFIPV